MLALLCSQAAAAGELRSYLCAPLVLLQSFRGSHTRQRMYPPCPHPAPMHRPSPAPPAAGLHLRRCQGPQRQHLRPAVRLRGQGPSGSRPCWRVPRGVQGMRNCCCSLPCRRPAARGLHPVRLRACCRVMHRQRRAARARRAQAAVRCAPVPTSLGGGAESATRSMLLLLISSARQVDFVRHFPVLGRFIGKSIWFVSSEEPGGLVLGDLSVASQFCCHPAAAVLVGGHGGACEGWSAASQAVLPCNGLPRRGRCRTVPPIQAWWH